MIVLRSTEAAAIKSRNPSGVIFGATWVSKNEGTDGDDGDEDVAYLSIRATSDASFSCAGTMFVESGYSGPRLLFLRKTKNNPRTNSKNTSEAPTETPAITPFEVDDLDSPAKTVEEVAVAAGTCEPVVCPAVSILAAADVKDKVDALVLVAVGAGGYIYVDGFGSAYCTGRIPFSVPRPLKVTCKYPTVASGLPQPLYPYPSESWSVRKH
jgi:hypothetical protein